MKTKPHSKISSLAILAFMGTTAMAATNQQPEIGRGILLYDKDAGFKDECIIPNSAPALIEDIRLTQYRLDLVQSKEELIDKITFSASGKGSYGAFSASAKSRFMKESEWNYNSNYILVRATRITHREVLANPTPLLKTNALNLFRDSKFRFNEVCGNSFATSVNLGGEIYGLIEIKAKTYQEKQEIESSIKGSGGFALGKAWAKADYERTIRKLSSEYQVKVDFEHIGGQSINVPNTVDGLLELSSQIESISDAFPVAVSFGTREYSTLSNYLMDDKDPEVLILQTKIDWASNKLKLARNLYSKIFYILENPSEFKRFDEEELKSKMTYLDEKIIQLKTFIARSTSFMTASDISTLDLNLDAQLPEMTRRTVRRGLSLSCTTKASPICGVESYRSEKTSACGVTGLREGTGPVCGTVYKEAPSPFCGIKSYNFGRGAVCGVELYQKCYHGKPRGMWGKRPHGRDPSCGVETYNRCQSAEFGPAEFNTCRHESNGIERYNTCKHKDFGYEFETCRHFSHGPDTYRTCDIATVGNQEIACPTF